MVCREAKIIKKGDEWFIYITVEKKVEERNPKSILAVDFGKDGLPQPSTPIIPDRSSMEESLGRLKGTTSTSEGL